MKECTRDSINETIFTEIKDTISNGTLKTYYDAYCKSEHPYATFIFIYIYKENLERSLLQREKKHKKEM